MPRPAGVFPGHSPGGLWTQGPLPRVQEIRGSGLQMQAHQLQVEDGLPGGHHQHHLLIKSGIMYPSLFFNATYFTTSKMRFTNNRLTGLQTDITWLGSSRLSRIQQNYKYTWLGFSLVQNNTKETFAQKSAT